MSMELSMAADVNVPGNSQPALKAGYGQQATAASGIAGAEQSKQAEQAQRSEPSQSRSAPAAQALSSEQLEMMAQKLQDFVGSLNRGLEFSVDEDSGRDVIKVIDRNSGEIMRQYPSEEVLDLVASLSDAAGTFVNIKA